jgi:hypothetical protein
MTIKSEQEVGGSKEKYNFYLEEDTYSDIQLRKLGEIAT